MIVFETAIFAPRRAHSKGNHEAHANSNARPARRVRS